jgi:hypothetical protein
MSNGTSLPRFTATPPDGLISIGAKQKGRGRQHGHKKLEAHREQIKARAREYPETGRKIASLQKGAPARNMRWYGEFIPCAKHPYRRCNRSSFANKNVRRCARCLKRRSDGSLRPAYVRAHRSSEMRRRRRNWMITNPEKFVRWMQGDPAVSAVPFTFTPVIWNRQ